MIFRAILFLAVAIPAFSQTPGSPGQNYPWASNNGAWTFFTDPRAMYYRGTQEKVYLGFISQQGSDRVWSYDYATGTIDTATLHAILQVDDHDEPALYVRTDGRITAFYQRHNTDRNLYIRTTVNPEDIRTWGAERIVTMPAAVTYAHPFRMAAESNRLYLFSRSINFHPTVMSSTDEGLTWGTPSEFIAGGGARPYVKYRGDGLSRIHFSFTDGHPRDEPTNSIYYANFSGGSFYRANGTLIRAYTAATPLLHAEAEKVYNGAAATGRAWIWDIAMDSLGRPVMVFVVAPLETDHRYYYARWNGTSWLVRQICAAGSWFPETPTATVEREPHYSGGIIINPQNVSEVFLSRPPNGVVGGTFEIERWFTSDGGTTWTSQSITSGSSANNVRPILPWAVTGQSNPRPLIFWMHGHYVHYTNYQTGIKYMFLPTTVPVLGKSLQPAWKRIFGSLFFREESRDALGRVPIAE